MSVIDAPSGHVSFLLRFDRHERVTTVEPFEDPVAAETAFDRAELEQGRDDNVDMVLVAAADLGTVRITHASYFTGQDVRVIDRHTA